MPDFGGFYGNAQLQNSDLFQNSASGGQGTGTTNPSHAIFYTTVPGIITCEISDKTIRNCQLQTIRNCYEAFQPVIQI